MQRDDISIVTKGCLAHNDPRKWDCNSVIECVARQFKGVPYHKFRSFERHEDGTWLEKDGFASMYVSDYYRYLKQVMAAQAERNSPAAQVRRFEYTDPKGVLHVIENVLNTAVYMVDIEMSTHVTKLDREFKYDFKLKEMLPGGDLDLMNSVSRVLYRARLKLAFHILPNSGYSVDE